jgi:hypothetical protein
MKKRFLEHVIRMRREGNKYKLWPEDLEEKNVFKIYRRPSWEDNSKMVLKEKMGGYGMDAFGQRQSLEAGSCEHGNE